MLTLPETQMTSLTAEVQKRAADNAAETTAIKRGVSALTANVAAEFQAVRSELASTATNWQ
jgi:hypothetical protein